MRRSKQTKTKLMFGWRGESAVRQRAVQANQPALSNHVTAPGYKYQPAPSTPSSEHSQLQNRGAKFRTRIKMDVWHNDALGERVVGQPSSPLGPSEYPVLWRILRTEDLREWGDLIRSCVVKKKDEFGQMKSTDEFWRYREAVTGYTREGDAWLLSRQVPSSAHQHPTRTTTGAGIGAKVEDADSGLDSLQEEVGEKGRGDVGEPVIIQSDEMQEVRLNMRARNAANTRTTRRMKIPDNLSKVTKV